MILELNLLLKTPRHSSTPETDKNTHDHTMSLWPEPRTETLPTPPARSMWTKTSVIEDPHLTANRPILVKLTKAPRPRRAEAGVAGDAAVTGAMKLFRVRFAAE